MFARGRRATGYPLPSTSYTAGEILNGTAGADNINGAQGDDIITGGLGDDLLAGAQGNDLFVFNDGDGNDTITGFAAGAGSEDVIVLSGNTFNNSFADVQAHASQVVADTEIDLGGGDTVTLKGVNVDDLHEDDFLFANAPVILGPATGAVEEDGTLSASGQLDAAFVDIGAPETWTVQGGGTGTYGSLSVDATGLWKRYDFSEAPEIDYRVIGEKGSLQ